MPISALMLLKTLPQEILGYCKSRVWKKQLSALRPKDMPEAEAIKVEKKCIEEIKAIELEYGIKLYICPYDKHRAHPVLKHISGSSIGRWVCLNDRHDIWVIRHEAGHKVDSDKLGWLYLPVIGIPSASNNLKARKLRKTTPSIKVTEWYYNTRPERRADRNAGIKREYVDGRMMCTLLDAK